MYLKKKKIDLVILAGGKGTRIKKFLDNIPKPLYKFDNISFLQLLLNNYCKYPLENIYIMCGYKGSRIYKKYNNKIINFVSIKCYLEKKPLGTAGALGSLKKTIKNDFFLINGDSFCDFKLNEFFYKNYHSNKIFLTNNKTYKSNSKLTNLSIDKDNKIIFNKKSNLMNAGIYFFKKKFLKRIKKNSFSLENELIPQLIKEKKLEGVKTHGYFIDIGTEKNLFIAKKKLPLLFRKPAAFLDRDGVINYDKNYVYKIKDFKFKKSVFKFLKFLTKKNYYIFIITNQAGIAKKKFSLSSFFKLHKHLKHFLNQKHINIDDVQYCPYHKNGLIEKYKKNSIFRKPKNGMIKNIERNWFLKKRKSFFIGDKLSDKLCAKKSNLYYEFAKENLFNQAKQLVNK